MKRIILPWIALVLLGTQCEQFDKLRGRSNESSSGISTSRDARNNTTECWVDAGGENSPKNQCARSNGDGSWEFRGDGGPCYKKCLSDGMGEELCGGMSPDGPNACPTSNPNPGGTDICPQGPTSENCNFYQCAEIERKDCNGARGAGCKCGDTGYPLGYGLKYCERFGGGCDGALTSPNAKAWITGTTKCLQDKIANSSNLSCEELKCKAFNSHAECYTYGAAQYGGVSICLLDNSEWATITSCVSLSDMVGNPCLTARQMAEAAAMCANIFGSSVVGQIVTSLVDNQNLPTNLQEALAQMTPEERTQRKTQFENMRDQYNRDAGNCQTPQCCANGLCQPPTTPSMSPSLNPVVKPTP